MYGEGNSAKLLGDIINGTTQVTEGLSSGMGLDIKSLIAGAIGGKLTAQQTSPVIVMDIRQLPPSRRNRLPRMTRTARLNNT